MEAEFSASLSEFVHMKIGISYPNGQWQKQLKEFFFKFRINKINQNFWIDIASAPFQQHDK